MRAVAVTVVAAPAAVGLAVMLHACSWMHEFRVENVGGEPAAITYQLGGTGHPGFFPHHAQVFAGRDTTRVDLSPSDSTITLHLPPGSSALLAKHINTSYRWVHEHSEGGLRDNLLWMTVRISDMMWRYERGELIGALAVKSNTRSVLRVGQRP
jgi:hypothetical protein